jgi:lactate racemase
MYRLPYGRTYLELILPEDCGWDVGWLAPAEAACVPDPRATVTAALDERPVEEVVANVLRASQTPLRGNGAQAVVAINDKTRPVPHQYLLPPLLARLEHLGFAPARIALLIATGTHAPMTSGEFGTILPPEILARYPVFSHDCNDADNLLALGATGRGTPVAVNRRWWDADLRIVVGNIEPHQFMGFSGGVKSAAVGLTAKATINANHSMMTAPGAEINRYEDNPCRQDVEEIGRMIGVHYAVNAVINDRKEIAHVLAGAPLDVMQRGIPLLRRIFEVVVEEPFDLIFTAPGGHPKDINLYQAQKALAHAALVTRPAGIIVLVAACPEGTGSAAYESWMDDPSMTSHEAVLARYAAEGYRIGPHKAWQLARDASRYTVLFRSEMPAELCRKLLLSRVTSLDEALALARPSLPSRPRVGIMPLANATIPVLR